MVPALTVSLFMSSSAWHAIGWVSVVGVLPAEFVGAVNMVALRLVDRPHTLGGIEPGLAPHLKAAGGTGEEFSIPAGRYRNSLASGL